MLCTLQFITGVMLGGEYLELGEGRLILINLLIVRILIEW